MTVCVQRVVLSAAGRGCHENRSAVIVPVEHPAVGALTLVATHVDHVDEDARIRLASSSRARKRLDDGAEVGR
jgi:hypothetical protein